jgi:hypothetical protein
MVIRHSGVRGIFLAGISFFVLFTFCHTAVAQISSEAYQSAIPKFTGGTTGQKSGPLAKVGMDLALLNEEYKQHALSKIAAPFVPSNHLMKIIGQQVVVDVVAESDPVALEAQLRGMGMQVTGRAGRIVSGLLPLSSIEALAASDFVRFAQPAMAGKSARAATS